MNREAVVQKLQRAIGAAGRTLLDQFNLLKPLVEQMVTNEAIVDVVVSEEQVENARSTCSTNAVSRRRPVGRAFGSVGIR